MRLSTPVLSKAVLLAVLVVTFASPAALAGWGPDGATIKSTTNEIVKVAAASDGGFGTIVVWQEESAPGNGILRAQHVLATGDVDPAWAADGVVLCDVATARAAIGVVPDRLGGAYAWWKEGATIYLTRVDASGAVAAGWPARGRSLGTTSPPTALPHMIEDGANGVYAVWATSALAQFDPMAVKLARFGPANTGTVRNVAGDDPVATLDYWPRVALAPDGGAFVAWATHSDDPQVLPSSYRLRRLTAAGLPAVGWPVEGLDLGVFHGEWLDTHPETGLIGLSPDGQGGVFALIGFLTGNDGYSTTMESRVLRLLGDGAPAPDWPAAGAVVNSGGVDQYVDLGPDASHRVFPDGLGGAQVGLPSYQTHGSSYVFFAATLPDGDWKPSSSTGGELNGYEVIPNQAGGVFFASFYPKGPSVPYEPYAYLGVRQSLAPPGWSDFQEIHFDIVVEWYGDIALAESGDGGAVFFWSQMRERFGLFARRFSGAGEVTGVETPIAFAPSLGRLRFVSGEGVRVSLSLPPGEAARLDLYDVTGRRVAGTRVWGLAGFTEFTLPGTQALPSGLYFAKLASARGASTGRLVVAR